MRVVELTFEADFLPLEGDGCDVASLEGDVDGNVDVHLGVDESVAGQHDFERLRLHRHDAHHRDVGLRRQQRRVVGHLHGHRVRQLKHKNTQFRTTILSKFIYF